jgi:cellulose synthase/poly-beta-1,6-N-acetylglucosamine synthase-like glycosyltransferase
MEFVFWGSVFLVFHAYFGYPLSLWVLSRVRNKKVRKADFFPRVTLIIAACDEEKRIREKLENTLELDYPRDLLRVIVASDGSTDDTNAIVKEYAGHGIELLAIPERRGKENAQKEAVAQADGDVIVFSDTSTRIPPEGLKEIVANFADPSVGCVSSVDRIVGQDANSAAQGFMSGMKCGCAVWNPKSTPWWG